MMTLGTHEPLTDAILGNFTPKELWKVQRVSHNFFLGVQAFISKDHAGFRKKDDRTGSPKLNPSLYWESPV